MTPAQMLGAALIAALLAACTDDSAEREIECQRRLVEAAAPASVVDGRFAGAFDAARQRLEALPRDGCSEDQSARIDLTARAAGRLAAAARAVGGDLRGATEAAPSLARNEAFARLQHELEGYERRRQVMRAELEAMAAGRSGR